MYIESIMSSCSFVSHKCSSQESYAKGECYSCEADGCASMGYYADDFVTSGQHYLTTTGNEAAFCSNQYLFELTVSSSSEKSSGELLLRIGSESTPISVIP
jgi:hypothetical protein